LIGRSISIGHKDLLGHNLSFLRRLSELHNQGLIVLALWALKAARIVVRHIGHDTRRPHLPAAVGA
jgi:hypothetical protein